MKRAILAILLVSAACAFGQARFAGEYVGVLSSSHTNAPERYLASVLVYPDGRCVLSYWDFERRTLLATGEGTITSKGKLEITVNGDKLKGMLTSRGAGQVSVSSAMNFERQKIRWAASLTRRFRFAYDPTP